MRNPPVGLLLLLILVTEAFGADPILTPRLSIRRLTWADRAFYGRVMNDQSVVEQANAKLPEPDLWTYFFDSVRGFSFLPDRTRVESRGYLIQTREKSEPVGVYIIEESEPRGYWEETIVMDPKHQGQGLGKEARRAMLSHCFEKLEIPGLIDTIAENNTASLRIAEGLGFRLVSADLRQKEREVFTQNHKIRWRQYHISADDYRRGVCRRTMPLLRKEAVE